MAEGKTPPSHDKQMVRDWGKSVGVDKSLNPENEGDLAFAHSITLPPDISQKTSTIYLQTLHKLIGVSLAEFQHDRAGMNAG